MTVTDAAVIDTARGTCAPVPQAVTIMRLPTARLSAMSKPIDTAPSTAMPESTDPKPAAADARAGEPATIGLWSGAEPARRSLFQGRIIDVGIEQVRLPNGRDVELEIVRHPGGAAAIAIDERRRVCLLRQYRHASGGWLWELPAGKLDPGEAPATTAERELAEEAGVIAASWDSLGRLHSSPGILAEVIHLYLARGLREVALGHEDEEVIEVHWLPLEQALQWCLDGTITDAKTLVGLYRADAWLRAVTTEPAPLAAALDA